jgi:hypothetical protein
MFKSVEYIGFDEQPELKMRAEQLTLVLASEIHRWREEVGVRWSPDPADPAGTLNTTLSLTLPNGGVSGSAFGIFSRKDLAEDWRLRSRCRGIWSDLLGGLLKEQDERVKESLIEELKEVIEKERDSRRSEIKGLEAIIEKERDARAAIDRENATLKQQLQDHIAQYQEWERRRWGLIVILISAVLSLASGLIVTLSRK